MPSKAGGRVRAARENAAIGKGPSPRPPTDSYGIADVFTVLYRRKFTFLVSAVAVILLGLAYTAYTVPAFESRAELVPLEQPDVIKNWLESRSSAQYVVTEMGTNLVVSLYPSRWDYEAGDWAGPAPTLEQSARRLQQHVTVITHNPRDPDNPERLIELRVELSDPVLARDVTARYLISLNELRPKLENITRQEAFDIYYNGENEQDAQRQAEVAAKNRAYWIILDGASFPDSASKPNVVANAALSVLVGLFLATFMVFFVEWIVHNRRQHRTE